MLLLLLVLQSTLFAVGHNLKNIDSAECSLADIAADFCVIKDNKTMSTVPFIPLDSSVEASATAFPFPNFMKSYEATGNASLEQLGHAAAGILHIELTTYMSQNTTIHYTEIINSSLEIHGALRFRNLQLIKNATQFSQFWNAVVAHSGMQSMKYLPFGGNRLQQDGIDLATNIPGSLILPPHNEMV